MQIIACIFEKTDILAWWVLHTFLVLLTHRSNDSRSSLCQEQERQLEETRQKSCKAEQDPVLQPLISFPTIERNTVTKMDFVLDNLKHHGP